MHETVVIPCLSDNYAVVLHDPERGMTALVDAPEAAPIMDVLEERGWPLTHILITHHHADHINGLAELVRRYQPHVIGPKHELPQHPLITERAEEGQELQICGYRIAVLDTPGHSHGHVCYYWPELKLLFAGDTLFSLGCGRTLEGDPPTLWRSLQKIRALPDETDVFFGHEYTLSNARFALHIDPENAELQAFAQRIITLRHGGHFTIPTRLGLEKRTNPFLRADHPELAKALHAGDIDPAALFTVLRQKKDVF